MNQAQFYALPEVKLLQEIQGTHPDGSEAHESAFSGLKALLTLHMGEAFAQGHMGGYDVPVKSKVYQNTVKLAEEFRTLLRAALSGNELIEADRLNNIGIYDNCCASHDFCDANVYMDKAFTKAMGYRMNFESDADMSLINSAWSLAKAMGYRWQLIDAVIKRGGTALQFVQALGNCRRNPELESAPLVVLFEEFGIKDPHYVLDLQKLVKELK